MNQLRLIATRSPLAFGIVGAICVVALDQLSKWIVVRELGPDPGDRVVTIIPRLFRLIFVRNTGSAFGMFQGRSEVLKFVAIAAVIILAGYFLRTARNDWMIALALGLQVGGAAGNLIDRFHYSYVVDWIDFTHFPTFNVADSAITIGVVLLLYALIFRLPEAAAPRQLETDGSGP